MGDIADGLPTDGLWNWSATGVLEPAAVRAAVAGALQRPVAELGLAELGLAELGAFGDAGAVLCDVWHVGGDFPTLIDCYLTPGELTETTIASAVAVRLGADLLLPDDTLNPTRYVLAEPDGTLRTVHVDEIETDDGPERRHLRPCTGADPACAAAPERDAA